MAFSRCYVGFGAGFGYGSFISQNGSKDPDPYKNETDSQHWNNILIWLVTLRDASDIHCDYKPLESYFILFVNNPTDESFWYLIFDV